MNYNSYQLPPPKDWQNFERLTHDLFTRIWNDSEGQLFGRIGQPQNGVDVFGRDSKTGEKVGVQCKGKDQNYGAGVTEKELKEEVENAKAFTPKLDKFILVTTFNDDVALQKLAGELSDMNKQSGEFEVVVLGWGNLMQRISNYEDLVLKYWPQFGYARFPKSKFDSRVQNFLSEYLGNGDKVIPFGGRQEIFNDINQWLSAKSHPNGGQCYRIFQAEAGRGKSALLVRWWSAFSCEADLAHVVFVPVSVRFNTNSQHIFFTLLASRLAVVYGESSEIYRNANGEQLRELCSDYLFRISKGNKKVLLIIDGLDEADNWDIKADLFPLNHDGRLYVIISTRQQADDWDGSRLLTRLGWNNGLGFITTIANLSKDEVKDILINTQVQGVDSSTELIEKFYEICEGDPLIMSLYIKDLLSSNLSFQQYLTEIIGQPSGLKGYFDRWWDEQLSLWKDNNQIPYTVQTLLNLLAFAKGPLYRENLLTLIYPSISSYDLDGALKIIKRFVIGSSGNDGYTFSHPRFGYFIEDRLSIKEREHCLASFIEWGADIFIKLITNEDIKVPEYLLQYYASHLIDSNRKKELENLITKKWIDAHLSQYGTYQSFIYDLDKIDNAIVDSNTSSKINAYLQDVGFQFHLLTCYTRIRSASQKFFPLLIERYFDAGLLTLSQAIVYAQHYPYDAHQLDALLRLMENPKSRRDEGQLVDKIISIFILSDSSDPYFDFIRKLSKHISAAYKHKLVEYVLGVQNKRRFMLKMIIYGHLEIEEQKDVFTKFLMNEKMTSEGGVWLDVFPEFIKHLSEEQNLSIYTKNHSLKDEYLKNRIFACLLPYLPIEKQESIVLMLKEESQKNGETFFINAIIDHIPFLKAGLKERTALEVLHHILSLPYSVDKVIHLIKSLSFFPNKTVLYKPILDCIHNLPNNKFAKNYYLTNFIESISSSDDGYQEYLALANRWLIELPWEVEKGYLAIRIAKFESKERQVLRLKEIYDSIPAYRDPHVRIKVYHDLYQRIGEGLRATCIEEIINSLRDLTKLHIDSMNAHMPGLWWSEIASCSKLTRAILPDYFHDELVTLILSIQDSSGRALALAGILPVLSETKRKQCINEALKALNFPIPIHAAGEQSITNALIALIPYLSDEQIKAIQHFENEIKEHNHKLNYILAINKRCGTLDFQTILELIEQFEYPNWKINYLASIWTEISSNFYPTVQRIIDGFNIYSFFHDDLKNFITIKFTLLRNFNDHHGMEHFLNEIEFIGTTGLQLQFVMEDVFPFLPQYLHNRWMTILFSDILKEHESPSFKILRLMFTANILNPQVDKNVIFKKYFFNVFTSYEQHTDFETTFSIEISHLINSQEPHYRAGLIGLFARCSSNLDRGIRYSLFNHSLTILKENQHWTAFENFPHLFELVHDSVNEEIFGKILADLIETDKWWRVTNDIKN